MIFSSSSWELGAVLCPNNYHFEYMGFHVVTLSMALASVWVFSLQVHSVWTSIHELCCTYIYITDAHFDICLSTNTSLLTSEQHWGCPLDYTRLLSHPHAAERETMHETCLYSSQNMQSLHTRMGSHTHNCGHCLRFWVHFFTYNCCLLW